MNCIERFIFLRLRGPPWPRDVHSQQCSSCAGGAPLGKHAGDIRNQNGGLQELLSIIHFHMASGLNDEPYPGVELYAIACLLSCLCWGGL